MMGVGWVMNSNREEGGDWGLAVGDSFGRGRGGGGGEVMQRKVERKE